MAEVECNIPIDITPSIRKSSGNLDKAHFMRRLFLHNPDITPEEAMFAFDYYDETISICTYNSVRRHIHGPRFTKKKTRKKRNTKIAAAKSIPTQFAKAAETPPTATLKMRGLDQALTLALAEIHRLQAKAVVDTLSQLVEHDKTELLSTVSTEMATIVQRLREYAMIS
jgi:hypothetical protein